MTLLQKENLILEKQVHSYQTAIAQKDNRGEYEPSQMTSRPQPPGQAQPGYGSDTLPDRPHNAQDTYYRQPMPQNHMGAAAMHQMDNQYPQANMGMHTAGMQGNPGSMSQNHTGYDTGYSRNELGIPDQYDRQQPRNHGMDGNSLPVPADRGPRSRSADPGAPSYFSPVPERRSSNRRNSTTGAEYADYLEQTPNSRHNRIANNYDGYRSDSGYRSDTMAKPNDPRYNEHYGKDGSRPRPSMRTSKPSDSRSDYGDYYSERRSKTSYDRDVDVYSNHSHKSSGAKSSTGSRNGRGQPVGDNRRTNNFLNSTSSTGRASYAGYENDYLPPDGRAGSSYPNTPRTSAAHRGGGYQRHDDRRIMENVPQ